MSTPTDLARRAKMPLKEGHIRSLLYHLTLYRKDFSSTHMLAWFDEQIAYLRTQLITRDRTRL